MKKLGLLASLILIGLLFYGPDYSFCQRRQQAGIHFLLAFPQGEFGENVENTGQGFNIYYAHRFPRSRFSVGISLGLLIYASETFAQPLSPALPDMTVDVTTDNNIVLGHLFLRYQPQKGRFRPFVDGLVGINYLNTDTHIKGHNSDWYYDDQNANMISSSVYDDLAFSFGVGVGTMITLLHDMDLDAGVRYIIGGEVKYLKIRSIDQQNGIVIYDIYRSRTNLLGAYIGVSFNF